MATRKLVALASLFAVVVCTSTWSAVPIDGFITAQGPVTRTAPGDIGTPVGSTALGGDMIGGERDIRVDLIGGDTTRGCRRVG